MTEIKDRILQSFILLAPTLAVTSYSIYDGIHAPLQWTFKMLLDKVLEQVNKHK